MALATAAAVVTGQARRRPGVLVGRLISTISDLGYFGKLQDRVALPIHAGLARLVKFDLFLKAPG